MQGPSSQAMPSTGGGGRVGVSSLAPPPPAGGVGCFGPLAELEQATRTATNEAAMSGERTG